MEQISTDKGRRVDYLVIYAEGSYSFVREALARWSAIVQEYAPTHRNQTKAVCWKAYPSHRRSPGTAYEKFECWGVGSDALAQTLTPLEWSRVERCDWREEFGGPPVSLRQLEDRAHAVCQGGIRITRDVSRLRARRGGRDGGGELLGVGSHKSDYRLTVYKRGVGDWAAEVQVRGKMMSAMLGMAGHIYSLQECRTLYEAVQKVWSAKLHSVVQARLDMPFAVLVGDETYVPTEDIMDRIDHDFGYWLHQLKTSLSKLTVEETAQELYTEYERRYGGSWQDFNAFLGRVLGSEASNDE